MVFFFCAFDAVESGCENDERKTVDIELFMINVYTRTSQLVILFILMK